jgi:DHA2 family multidrug resistance protein
MLSLLLIPSSITTGMLMPFIVKWFSRGVPQAYMSSCQFLMFFLFYFWMQSVITPDSGEHLYWPLILRGMGLGYYLFPYLHFLIYFKKKHWVRSRFYRNDAPWLGGSLVNCNYNHLLLDSIKEHRVNLMYRQNIIWGLQNGTAA